MALARYEHQGAAAPTTLATGINNSVTTFAVATGGGSGYPTGIVGDFIMCLDAGTPAEEKMLCSGRASDTFTVVTRGIDGTAPAAHSSGAVVTHVFGAIEADDDNDHVYTTTRDDHTQYARTDGTRYITGLQTFDAGIVVTGNQTISGTLGVTGVTTLTGGVPSLSVAGALAAASVAANYQGVTGRYVGVTSGAPALAASLKGDFADDPTNGCFWICTVAGTPGTWGQVGAGATDAAWTDVLSGVGFKNSWVNFGAPTFNAAFRLVNGRVWVRGTVKSGTVPSVVFTLPVGYRPSHQVGGDQHQTLQVDTSGDVHNLSGNTQISIDGLSFDLL